MAHPKADPAALAARWLGPLRDHPLLVVDPPDLAAAETLDPERGGEVRWFCTHWPTHAALLEAGYGSSFGPWFPPRLELDGVGSGGVAAAEAFPGPSTPAPPPHAALFFLSRSRERNRMTLAMLTSALPTGAPLWVVGAKGDGIESAGPQVGEVTVSEGAQVGKHSRLLMGRTGEMGRKAASLKDFLSEWALHRAPGDPTPLRIASLPGVFSHGRLDDGTRLLLEAVPDLPGPILDVGCGAGILGAWYAARGSGPVTLVDADALALESARRTLALNGLEGQVEAGDVYPPSAEGSPPPTFTSIVSNPPFHQGSATDDRVTATLIAGASTRLRPGGTLTLVCNRFLPIPDRLDRAFGGHEALADDARYRVYQVTRR